MKNSAAAPAKIAVSKNINLKGCQISNGGLYIPLAQLAQHAGGTAGATASGGRRAVGRPRKSAAAG